LGVSPGEFSPTFEKYCEFICSDELDLYLKTIRSAQQNKTSYEINYHIIRKDKVQRIIHDEGEVTLDENNEVIGIFGVIQDVTGQRQLESKLSRSIDAKNLLNRILKVNLDETSLKDKLNNILDIILTIPFFSFNSFFPVLILQGHSRQDASSTRVGLFGHASCRTQIILVVFRT